jgi:hypothetical protein
MNNPNTVICRVDGISTRVSAMSLYSTEQIASRAYGLWEKAGRPEGHAEEFWVSAERELRAEAAAPTFLRVRSPVSPPQPVIRLPRRVTGPVTV